MGMRCLLVVVLLGLAGADTIAFGQSCGGKRYCREMTSCAEARFYLETCGLSQLDGDGDGSPCESLCGDGGNRRSSQSSKGGNATPLLETAPLECGAKSRCREMTSCAEATFYLKTCGVSSLDGNNDGIACNALCK